MVSILLKFGVNMTNDVQSLLVPEDGRQSPAAAAIARGVRRHLWSLGFSTVTELSLANGRRADVVGLSQKGEIWIVEGIEDTKLGDFGFSGGGAAGFELDRADTRLGTPPNVRVIASSENHSESFVLVPEEHLTHITNWPGAPVEDLLRADMIYYDVPGGGAVRF